LLAAAPENQERRINIVTICDFSDNAALLSRRWREARQIASGASPSFGGGHFDSLAKLVASVHRRNCELSLSRPGWFARQAA
jgi:hypothetical protein